MNFALPVSYLDDQAVILGQGSFASYENYRSYLDLLQTTAPDAALPVSATLRFTTEQDARNACLLIERSVELLLHSTQEASELKKTVVGLKKIMRSWPGIGGKGEGLAPENLARTIMSIIDIKRAAVLTLDHGRQRYVASQCAGTPASADGNIELDASDQVVGSLRNGEPFVVTAKLTVRPEAACRSEAAARYFFPIWVRGGLENILLVDDGLMMESDLQTIQSLCHQTSKSIENKRLHQDLSWKFSRIASVTEVSRELSNIDSYEALLRSVLERSAKLLMAEQGSLMLLDQETDALLVKAQMGGSGAAAARVRIPRGEGIAGRVAEKGEPFLVENVESDPRIGKKNRENYRTRSFISVPLMIGDRTIGVLNLADKTTGEVFNRDDLNLIQSFATHAAVVLERSTLSRQTEHLRKLTITDPLTGLLNRRYFQERLEEEVARSLRHNRSLSLLMLDVDGFKRFNDTYGHTAGDEALRLVGEALLRIVRHMDVVSRFGGDEFVVILPETDSQAAMHIAERIREEVAAAVTASRSARLSAAAAVTVSTGIASYEGQGESGELLLERADQALYKAKAGGRNRVEVYS
jgi:diguanylate cyclase (GGDEF)-like protein